MYSRPKMTLINKLQQVSNSNTYLGLNQFRCCFQTSIQSDLFQIIFWLKSLTLPFPKSPYRSVSGDYQEMISIYFKPTGRLMAILSYLSQKLGQDLYIFKTQHQILGGITLNENLFKITKQ